MMRNFRQALTSKIVTLVLLGTVGIVGFSQSTADGTIKDGTYHNSYFKIELKLPGMLHAVDPSSLRLTGAASTNEFCMLAAKQENQPYGIVMLAERLDVGRLPIRDESDFLNRIQKGWQDGEIARGKHAIISKDGTAFQQLDFMVGPEFNSAIASRVGDYLMVWRCNARTQADLDVMNSAVYTMHAVADKP